MVYGCEGTWFFGSSSPLVPKTKVENLQKAPIAPMASTAPVAPAAPKLVSTERLFSLFSHIFQIPNFILFLATAESGSGQTIGFRQLGLVHSTSDKGQPNLYCTSL